jgi:hypothetical protein
MVSLVIAEGCVRHFSQRPNESEWRAGVLIDERMAMEDDSLSTVNPRGVQRTNLSIEVSSENEKRGSRME